jgi:lysyl-tRNA synthetase class I
MNLQEQIRRLLRKYLVESDPKVGTGKKPKDSDRRLYTDENPKDTVSVKFRTKQDIVDTLNKESFKSKSHARQSQIINLIHQRLRVALERAKDPEVKKRLRTAFEYIESKKEQSKKKTQEMLERIYSKRNENYVW